MPRYYYTQVNELKSELLVAATKDARTRAQTLAEGSGVAIGGHSVQRVREYSVCVLQIPVVFLREAVMMFPLYPRRLLL